MSVEYNRNMDWERIISSSLERNEGSLIRYACGITGDLESAKDVVQETFLKLSQQDLPSIEDHVDAWLFRVCRNCALDYKRKIIKMPTMPNDHFAHEPSPEPDPSRNASTREESKIIMSLVSRLPERQRELIALKFSSDLSYKEMSDITGSSVSHVGVQLHDAIARLRILWKESTQTPTLKKSHG